MEKFIRTTTGLYTSAITTATLAQVLNVTPIAGRSIGSGLLIGVAIISGIVGFCKARLPLEAIHARLSAALMVIAMVFWSFGWILSGTGSLTYFEDGLSQIAFSERNQIFWGTLSIAFISYVSAFFYARTWRSRHMDKG